MNTLELMAPEENLIRALNEDILPSNKNLVYLYDLLMAQEIAGTVAVDGRWEIVLQFSQMNGIGVSQVMQYTYWSRLSIIYVMTQSTIVMEYSNSY